MRPGDPQRQDGALASCKSGENGAREVVPRNAREAGTAFTKSFDHEDQIDAVNTLPKQVVGIHVDPSVMWAVPERSEGSRSESPARTGGARIVTSEAVAKQASGGARLAPHGEKTLAQPAAVNEIEAIVNEGDVIAGRADEAVESAANAHDDIRPLSQTEGRRDDKKAAGANSVDEADPSAVSQRAASMPEEVVQQAYEIVRRARTLMATIKDERDRAKTPAPSDGSREDYAGDVTVLLQRASAAPETKDRPAILTALVHYAPSGSFSKMRSAAMHQARSQVTALLAEQDRLRRLAPRSNAWGDAIIKLGRGLRLLQDIRSLTRRKALQMTNAHARPPQSKKNVLRLADAGWRERYFSETATSEQYRHACFLLAAVGMRPQELMTGVMLQRVGDRVSVRIEGAKVTQHAGQKWRQMFVPVEQFPSWFGAEQLTVPTRFSAPKDPMRTFLHSLSSKVFPPTPGKKELVLSAYVLRHCVATDLWQNGWSVAEIAAVLGERVEKTAARYGLRTRGAKWRKPDVRVIRGEVTTAMPVRLRATNGFLESKRHVKARGPRPG